MTGTDCGLFTHKSVPVIFEPPCIVLSSICTSGLLFWAVRSLVVDLSLYSLNSPTQIVGHICNMILVLLLLGHI